VSAKNGLVRCNKVECNTGSWHPQKNIEPVLDTICALNEDVKQP
jgi:hypothetical protein